MCQCQDTNNMTNTNPNDALRAEIESLKSQIGELIAQRNKAMDELEEMKKKERQRDVSMRMSAMGVPQAVIDELMGIFDDMAEGSQEKLIASVGRLIDHIRAESARATNSVNDNKELRADALRAGVKDMLTKQVFPGTQQQSNGPVDLDWLKRDLEAFRSRFAQVNNKS